MRSLSERGGVRGYGVSEVPLTRRFPDAASRRPSAPTSPHWGEVRLGAL
jgi:hypothetical protein